MADMDKLKENIALALRRRNLDGPYNAATEWHDLAAAALTAIESAGFVIMPKDQILRKMTKDEFSELMAGIPFRENDLGCQASPGIKGETVSAAPLQSDIIAEAIRVEKDRLSKLTAEQLDLPKVDAYLRRGGWTAEPYGKFGTGWINGQDHYGVMPNTTAVRDYRIRMRELINAIADFEKRPVHAVLFAIDATEAANSQSPIEEAQRADTESAASAEVSLTPHKINQESDNG